MFVCTGGGRVDDPQVEPEPASSEAGPCPVCERPWADHNLPRARVCHRALEQALAIAEQLELRMSDPRKRLPSGILGVSQ